MKWKKKKRFTRFTVLVVLIFMLFSAMCARLVILQIVEAKGYSEDANTKAHKYIKEDAPRGQILDSTGTVLATSEQSFNVTYMETDDNKKVFYNTIAKVFSILDANGEAQDDDFALKVSPNYAFDFKTNDPSAIKSQKLRFLTDRGFRDNIRKNLYGSKSEKELTKEQSANVDKWELKITAKYAFEKLAGKPGKVNKIGYDIPTSYTYTMDGKTVSKKCTIEDIRRFMVVKDAVKMQSYSGYKPVAVASNIKRNTAFAFMQKLNELPGIDVATEPIRNYPYGELASNVIGYIGKITPNNKAESESYEERGYDVTSDVKGIAGIESAEEDRLRGSAGGKVVEVNRSGRVTNEIASRDPYPGQNIHLTLNKNVQYAGEQELLNAMKYLRGNPNAQAHGTYTGNATRGAAVAIDVNTGGILALVSEPNFNPNDFANPNGLSDALFNKYFPSDVVAEAKQQGVPDNMLDTLFPVDKSTGKRVDEYDYLPKNLYDYPTMALIQPGSTFKPITAIAGLETKVITPSTEVDDPGWFVDESGNKLPFTDGDLGTNDLANAIAKSSNAYFMTVGERLRDAFGEDIIAKYAWKFGLGVQPNSGVSPSTGIEIQENFGQVFNSYTIRNSFGQQAVWKVMADLQNKKYLNKDPAINLYTADSDSKDVQSLKADIKSAIKSAVVSGAADKSKLITSEDKSKIAGLITKFVQTDTRYSGKAFSSSNINKIVNGISGQVNYYIGQAIYPSNTYTAAIGQGSNTFTPLQIANYIATIANGGTRYKAHLIDSITDADGKVIKKVEPDGFNTGVSKSSIDSVKRGMELVNLDGTAKGRFDNLPFKTAGKTGTADPYEQEKEKEIGRTSYSEYVGYAPADNPKIAVEVVIFDGGFGTQATDVAKAMYEAYFKNVMKMTNIPNDFDVTARQEVDGN